MTVVFFFFFCYRSYQSDSDSRYLGKTLLVGFHLKTAYRARSCRWPLFFYIIRTWFLNTW